MGAWDIAAVSEASDIASAGKNEYVRTRVNEVSAITTKKQKRLTDKTKKYIKIRNQKANHPPLCARGKATIREACGSRCEYGGEALGEIFKENKNTIKEATLSFTIFETLIVRRVRVYGE